MAITPIWSHNPINCPITVYPSLTRTKSDHFHWCHVILWLCTWLNNAHETGHPCCSRNQRHISQHWSMHPAIELHSNSPQCCTSFSHKQYDPAHSLGWIIHIQDEGKVKRGGYFSSKCLPKPPINSSKPHSQLHYVLHPCICLGSRGRNPFQQ